MYCTFERMTPGQLLQSQTQRKNGIEVGCCSAKRCCLMVSQHDGRGSLLMLFLEHPRCTPRSTLPVHRVMLSVALRLSLCDRLVACDCRRRVSEARYL